jgi:hypothetical protein
VEAATPLAGDDRAPRQGSPRRFFAPQAGSLLRGRCSVPSIPIRRKPSIASPLCLRPRATSPARGRSSSARWRSARRCSAPSIPIRRRASATSADPPNVIARHRSRKRGSDAGQTMVLSSRASRKAATACCRYGVPSRRRSASVLPKLVSAQPRLFPARRTTSAMRCRTSGSAQVMPGTWSLPSPPIAKRSRNTLGHRPVERNARAGPTGVARYRASIP